MTRTMFENKAYTELIAPHRAELRAHCARLTGSQDDAEDAVQEAMLRAWRSLPRLAERRSARAWLYRIATNTSLDEIRRRPSADSLDDVELKCTRPAPAARYERREEVELALTAAYRVLPAGQRAVLILREVLGFSSRETAAMLGRTEAAVNSAMQRARAKVDAELLELDREQGLRSLADGRLRDEVRRCADAWERGEVGAVAAILVGDAGRPIGERTERTAVAVGA